MRASPAHRERACRPRYPAGPSKDWCLPRSGRKEFTVFQVKFSRNPNTKDARDAILGLIKTELTKVEQLKALGATSYYLITNVSGTSHLGTGSIDKTNEELTTTFGIPSYCWWRDDLVARANLNSNLKWSFPEIMRGTDVLQLLVEASLNENAVARNQALRSYLALQYRDDEEVRFKQVELNYKTNYSTSLLTCLLSGRTPHWELQHAQAATFPA